MAKPLVSVLMPCYNAAATLPETLQSLSGQSLKEFEIVAVDDGSEDGTLELLEDYAQKEKRLRVLPHAHAGIIPALNHGLENCRGEFVARMDADDISPSHRLEAQRAFLAEHNEIGLVASGVEGFPPSAIREGFSIYIEWLNSLVEHEQIMRELFVESPFAHPSVMFRRSLVMKLGGYEEHGWAEDYDLWLRMAEAGTLFAKLPQSLLQWRDHPPRLTRTDSRYSLSNFLRAKAHYLMRGPLADRKEIIIWGAGMMGKRLSKQLLDLNAPLTAFVEVDQKKIGRTRRGKPIIAADELLPLWNSLDAPILLAAVGARGARKLIREALNEMGLTEGRDWLAAA